MSLLWSVQNVTYEAVLTAECRHLSAGNRKSVLALRNLCSASGFMNNVPFPLSDTRGSESLVVISFAHSSLCLRLYRVLRFGHGCSLKE